MWMENLGRNEHCGLRRCEVSVFSLLRFKSFKEQASKWWPVSYSPSRFWLLGRVCLEVWWRSVSSRRFLLTSFKVLLNSTDWLLLLNLLYDFSHHIAENMTIKLSKANNSLGLLCLKSCMGVFIVFITTSCNPRMLTHAINISQSALQSPKHRRVCFKYLYVFSEG